MAMGSDRAETPGRRGIDPYSSGMLGGGKPVLRSRVPVAARIVALYDPSCESKTLALIHPWTRGVRRGAVHELMVTGDREARPGAAALEATPIAAIEFTEGGLVVGGDRFLAAGQELGTLMGFAENPAEGHLRLILRMPAATADVPGAIRCGAPLAFIMEEVD
jgi:hypothetical protein